MKRLPIPQKKEPEAADETSQDAGKETPAKEETKDAVKENTSPAAEQPKTEVKETTQNEASNTAEKKETKVAEAAKPADGEYETSAEATGSMFRVISSRLIVKDGKLKASILLSGTGYDYLYTGTAAEAAAADEKELDCSDRKRNLYGYEDRCRKDRISF